MTNLIAALKLLSYVLSGLYGVYYVAGAAMENVILKQEIKQDAKNKEDEKRHRQYDDSLEVARTAHFDEIAKRYQPNFTLEEQAEITERIINDGIKSIKRYVKNENEKQREEFEVFYFLDDNNQNFKMLSYKTSTGYIIIRQIPITQAVFEEINK